MKLLLISNSTNAGEGYLEHAEKSIRTFLKPEVKRILFVPYAGVSISWDDYSGKVRERFRELGFETESVHRHTHPVQSVQQAECIVVGGGNTFNLLDQVQRNGLLPAIREKVREGTPYIGWSAGSNLCCPSIKTTNDMPVVEPRSFDALDLVPFQINPHYLDANPEGHAGETREMRILEFLEMNREIYIVGLREGTMLQYISGELELTGPRSARIFHYQKETLEVQPGEKLDFLLGS